MIALSSDYLLFETAGGESVPFSAEMISIELSGDATGKFDPEFLKQAANAVFYYFKNDLGRVSVTVGEFAGALEKVLRGFGLRSSEKSSGQPRVLKSDLRQLAFESGKSFELSFFPRLRDELRRQLRLEPQLVHYRGLRGCVKQLAGARRWTARCQTLRDQIVEYLRHCFSAEASQPNCALLVD